MSSASIQNGDIIFTLDDGRVVTAVYGSGFDHYKLVPALVVGRSLDTLFDPESTAFLNKLIEQSSGNNGSRMEVRFLSLNGIEGFFRITVFPAQDNGINLILHDRTENRLQNEALKALEQQYRTMFDAIGDPISVIDREMRYLVVNRAFREWIGQFGFNDVLIGKTVFEVFPFLPDIVREQYDQVFEKGRIVVSEETNQLDVRAVTTETRKIPVFEGSAVIRVITIIRDISERVIMEHAVEENAKRFRELAELLPETICEASLDGRISYVNKNGLEKFEYTGEDVAAGLSVYDMILPEQVPLAMAQQEPLIQQKLLRNIEYTAVTKTGKKFPVLITTSLVEKENIPSGVRSVVVDISRRKKDEEERQKTQRLESIGILAGGIAHDFNNILTAVLGNISVLRMQTDKHDPRYEILDAARKASLRASDLTRQLLTFSRGGDPVLRVSSVEELTRDCVGFVLRGSNVGCRFYFSRDLRLVNIDRGQISQVIQNIVINANQVMNEGGMIYISGKNIDHVKSKKNPLETGSYVRLSFRDTGDGIPGEILGKIFDPYFSTKCSGNGLGLAIVYSILKKHNGQVTVTSKEGKGTTFRIYLPASKGSLPDKVKAHPVSKGTGKILLMDDEEDIREMMLLMLSGLGYQAVLAADGEEAVRLYQREMDSDEPFDIVILDLTVPGGVGGQEAIRRIKKINPGVRAVVSTGYSNDSVVRNYRDFGFSGVISKPFSIEDVCGTLEKLQ